MNPVNNNSFSLIQKTIIVTGAGSGLGKHFSITLAKAGAEIILIGRREELLVKVAQEIESFGGKAGVFSMDIKDFEKVEKHVSTIFERYKKVDVLVNNAGVSTKIKKDPFDYSLSEWDEVFNTNVKGLWHLTNCIAKKMIEQEISGSIINIASTIASRPRPKNSIYGVSKSAVEAITKNLAMDYAPYKIRVNAISPGFIETDLNRNFIHSPAGQELIQNRFPMRKVGNLKDLEGPILLLASEASSYMTGEIIYVDGGFITGAIM